MEGKYLVKHIQKNTYEDNVKYSSVEYTCDDLNEVSKLICMISIFANKDRYNDFSVNYIEETNQTIILM